MSLNKSIAVKSKLILVITRPPMYLSAPLLTHGYNKRKKSPYYEVYTTFFSTYFSAANQGFLGNTYRSSVRKTIMPTKYCVL